MKKIYLISAITIILGWLFTLKPDWFTFFWGWQILLLPLTAGILMVLAQNEDKSYHFLPKLIVGSFLTSFIFIIIWQIIIEYDYDGHFLFLPVLQTALFFAAIIIFGGLMGIVIRGITLLLTKNPPAKSVLVFKKIFGAIFLSLGTIGFLVSVVIFLILSFNSSSSLFDRFMVDFKTIEVIGIVRYYIFLLSALFIISIPTIFVAILGLDLLAIKKKFFNKKLFIGLILVFFLGLVTFFLLFSYTESKFEEKKAIMKENKIERYFDLKDFNSIYVSRFVKFDEITVRQGDKFSIMAKGSQYDLINLDFENINNTLSIKRSELESYYNTETWIMENDKIPFSAGTKYLKIEITMPDIKKIDWIIDKLKIFSKRIVENNQQNSYQNYQKNKKNAYIFIENKIKELNKVYNFKYSKISIRNQKTRWGSCSRCGNLNFSYKLIFLPEKLANYVIVHELCHLKEFNHSLAFWNLVSLSVPDFKTIRKELRNFTFDKNLFL
ncbi:MAG TPA: DUF45 domain-containing protein [bacterium]|nr:DUF45 domain-containing protein [bacterium]HPV65291.1 DUF45 domain-containing protein [bacterium]